MYVDASAVIAILTFEPEKAAFSSKLEKSERIMISAIGIYEAILGIRRIKSCDLAAAQDSIDAFVRDTKAEIVSIDAAIGTRDDGACEVRQGPASRGA